MKTGDLENRSRRDNIVVYGIPETQGGERETWGECEEAVREVLSDKLEIEDADRDEKVGIERAHRLGRRKEGGKPRPIIVKLTRNKSKSEILRQARSKLKHSQVNISEDFSFPVREKRRKLIPHLVKAREEGKEAFIRFDKLVINSTPYEVNVNRR
ncbi:uncharacterized protein LOC125376028 [Haliotis rufescens]|uniref:uncharacterized protein LOC125376028 n=1 Tax=Haliotis rufescens TaxID=6454 RepID=UPI00201F2DAD|nr:uncharacterized protein LOC125376028 [Haliotis rufescens]